MPGTEFIRHQGMGEGEYVLMGTHIKNVGSLSLQVPRLTRLIYLMHTYLFLVPFLLLGGGRACLSAEPLVRAVFRPHRVSS